MQNVQVLDSAPVALSPSLVDVPTAPAAALATAVDSATPAGERFPSILLPRHPMATFDPACPPVLVADDDADDTFFIQRLIKKTGIKNPVKTFDDGSEVVNFLGSVRRSAAGVRHRPPLLLFLDLKMAGLGGFGFLEWARQQQPDLAPLTIVVLSHTSDPEAMARARELGAHRYLVKYPSVRTFDSIVRSVYPQTVF
jgi:CheY-like chemotaxis protein